MKNTMEFKMTIGIDKTEIEGKCPNCMTRIELFQFMHGLYLVYNEAYEVYKERFINGKKKQGTQKKRQKDFRKSSRQNKKD